MLHSLRAHIDRVRKTQPGIRFRTPLLRDLNLFLQAERDNLSLACPLSFGLHLLIVSYKGYCKAGAKQDTGEGAERKIVKVPNPRILSLKFANHLKKDIAQMMAEPCAPCECLRVNGSQVAQQLKNLHYMLQDYTRTPRFDLLAQSPWISGQHVLDHHMLDLKYGLQSWHHGYFVGLVLHVYNALVHAAVLARHEIPVLEDLCNHFDDTVFMSSRESPNVYSCYKRWTGGRVKFSTHQRSNSSSQTSAAMKKWNKCSVSDASHGGDHKQRGFNSSKKSLFSLLAEGAHFLDDKVYAWTVTELEAGKSPKSFRAEAHSDSRLQVVSYIRQLSNILTAELLAPPPLTTTHTITDRPDSRTTPKLNTKPTISTLTPTIPSPALLNPFTIYRLCLLTLNTISDSTHTAEDKGILCRCMPERCLRACEIWHREALLASKGRVALMEDRGAVEACKRGLGAKDVCVGVV